MKRLTILAAAAIIILSGTMKAQDDQKVVIPRVDSLQFMAHVSLWYESNKNGDFQASLPHGFEILRRQPDFNKYKFYSRMEDMLRFMHDSVAVDDYERKVYADTLLYIYETAAKNDPEKSGFYLARKAFTLEQYYDPEPEVVIAAYERAIETGQNISDVYFDRLGLYYTKHADDTNDYKSMALELYSGLAEKDPTNETWVARMNNLAEDQDELLDIKKKAWDLDPESAQKAYSYAELCVRSQEFERAIEPLEFLTKQSPDVTNYWRDLARAYNKTERTDDAVNAYNTLIKLEPGNRDNYVNLAIIYQSQGQLSVSRSFLLKAVKADPDWDYPIYIEAQLYEEALRECFKGGQYELMDYAVLQLAIDKYNVAASKGGDYSSRCSARASMLNTKDFKENFQAKAFFQKVNSGDAYKINKGCYSWINRSIIVPKKG